MQGSEEQSLTGSWVPPSFGGFPLGGISKGPATRGSFCCSVSPVAVCMS